MREDLTRSFDNYVRLLGNADKIQRENVSLQIKLAESDKKDSVTLHSLNGRIEILTEKVNQRDNAIEMMRQNYDDRLLKLKAELERQRQVNKEVLLKQNFLDRNFYSDG